MKYGHLKSRLDEIKKYTYLTEQPTIKFPKELGGNNKFEPVKIYYLGELKWKVECDTSKLEEAFKKYSMKVKNK